MSGEERLNYLATTKDKGNKRYVALSYKLLRLRTILIHAKPRLPFRALEAMNQHLRVQKPTADRAVGKVDDF